MEVVPGPDRRMKWGTPEGAKVGANTYMMTWSFLPPFAPCWMPEWAFPPFSDRECVDPLKEISSGY